MACRTVSTLEEAEEQIQARLFPVYGLRRDANGVLTTDAIRTVIDGLKSRGIDAKDPDAKRELLRQMEVLFCTVKNQYDFLIEDMFSYLDEGKPIPARRIEKALEKNQYMQDLITVLRHIQALGIHDESTVFIEAWQNMTPPLTSLAPGSAQLERERQLLDSKRIYEMKMERVRNTQEKNKVATNYIGLYGFLNLVAIGLVVYATSE